MSERPFLVCPACERAEPATEEVPCPVCGSDRAYLHPEPALPDATSEAYVKLGADEVARETGACGESGSAEDPDASASEE